MLYSWTVISLVILGCLNVQRQENAFRNGLLVMGMMIAVIVPMKQTRFAVSLVLITQH